MIFKDEFEVIKLLESKKQVPKWIQEARAYKKRLFALVEGDGFTELLLKVENIESESKAKARRNYSRSTQDLFERLLRPVDNVFGSTGGIKDINIDNQKILDLVNESINNIRGDKSASQFVAEYWAKLYHIDPNGLCFVEYEKETERPSVAYKSIDAIRDYKADGQGLEWVIFEPKKKDVIVNNENKTVNIWRVVDDKMFYYFKEEDGKFTYIPDISYVNEVGYVPAFINSNIEKIGANYRISPLHSILMLCEEYLRDQSVLSIHKNLHGMAIHWRYVVTCKKCQGIGRVGNEHCPDCDGKGFYHSKDVTDMVVLPAPKTNEDVKLAPDIAGYITPPIEIWKQYRDEQDKLEDLAFITCWGSTVEKSKNETATGRFIDVQPVIKKLNLIADVADMVESFICECVCNLKYPAKDKNKKVCSIVSGRNYIIESIDMAIERYEKAKDKQDNVTILDRLFNEVLLTKYKGDVVGLEIAQKKARIEPFIHYTVKDVFDVFGQEEAKKKMLFQEWWETLEAKELIKDELTLKDMFSKYISNLN
jgi:hypothetical protein